MSGREVKCVDDLQALCAAAADEFVRCYLRSVESQPMFHVALSGGSTPRRLHRMLAASPYRQRIAWERVSFYFGDERTVHPGHSDSNFRMARETLFTELGIDDSQVHRMCAEQINLDQAARLYEEQLCEAFKTPIGGPPPRFDLILLGMGADGHTASLFPDTHALTETERWVVGNEVPQQGCSRMTFTYPLINAARCVVFMISGRAKAESLASVLEGPSDVARYPAQGVAPDRGRLLYLIDREAGEQLDANTKHCQPDGG